MINRHEAAGCQSKAYRSSREGYHTKLINPLGSVDECDQNEPKHKLVDVGKCGDRVGVKCNTQTGF